jgi:lactobin A/cerein 7B family class IIb bacteriocin
MKDETNMVELNSAQIEEVSGGLLPFIPILLVSAFFIAGFSDGCASAAEK